MKTFLSFGNEFLPPSRNISLTECHIIYPLKQKHLCDYDPRCIMSSGLMFDDIIMDIIRNKKLSHHAKKCLSFNAYFKQYHLYVQGSLNYFYWKKGTHECLEVPYLHFLFSTDMNNIQPISLKKHFKWWYAWKGRPLVGFLWKVPQKVYYYVFRIVKCFLSWRDFVHHCLITTKFY